MSDSPTSLEVHSVLHWSKILGRGEHVLRDWVANGWLVPSVTTGRIRLFSAQDIGMAIGRIRNGRAEEVEVELRELRGALDAHTGAAQVFAEMADADA